MSTEIPDIMDIPPEVRHWWGTMTDQERIIAALTAYENGLLDDAPSYVAEKPWKYAQTAYDFTHHQQEAAP